MQNIKDIDFAGKRVFVRVDFNVPLGQNKEVVGSTRIEAALPTIQFLKKKGAKIILASHLGRPNGRRDPAFSLKPVAACLAKKLEQSIIFLEQTTGEIVTSTVARMAPGSVLLLENLRFYPGEEANDPLFAQELANLADIYINDAFGTAHRAHASTVGVPNLLEVKAPGFLMEKELEFLSSKLEKPEQPFTVILGGAKVSDKIQTIETLLNKASTMLIGGAMAYTFALAQGKRVGASLVERDKVSLARALLTKAKARNVKFLLPIDNLATGKLDFKNHRLGNKQISEGNIPDFWEGVDIGPKTIKLYSDEIKKAKTILWNGPMGVFEIEESAIGTYAIAKAVAESSALSIVGGGDSVKALKNSGYSDKVSFVSTGGGASLKLLEGVELPGLKALETKKVEIKK